MISVVSCRCINGVLKNKPRLLVTHQLQYLQTADKILVLKEVVMAVVLGNLFAHSTDIYM